MKKVVVGINDYALMVASYLKDDGEIIDAFTVDDHYIQEAYINDIPVVGMSKLTECFSRKDTILYLAIGYSNYGKTRKKVYEKCKQYGYRFGNYIHKTAYIESNVILGEGNNIFEGVTIQKHVKIGNANLFFSNATIMHDNIIGDYNTFGACSVSNGIVTIGNCNFLGSNATLKDKIHIGNECLIGAGTYLRFNCEDKAIVRPCDPSISYERNEETIGLR